MPDDHMIEVLERRVERRSDRREFFRNAIGAAAITAVGASAISIAGSAFAQDITDADVLNFALNLEYLEANFYYYAAYGIPIDASLMAGVGGDGVKATGGRQVKFTDPVVKSYAREIAADEINHVKFLRTALGGAAVAQPKIDVGTTPDGAFSSAARAAKLVKDGESFDPYASDENFLLGAFIFEDVGVTAYKGAAPLLTNKTYLEAAAGILAVEAYHAALVRTTLYGKGLDTPSYRTYADAISGARDMLDGSDDLDQGISPMTSPKYGGDQSNIAPLDENALAFSRSTGQVLNIVYLTDTAASMGGFFPAGVNGAIKTSANSTGK